MDGEAWNTYHIFTNRAKSVCTTIRQDQFRGLTELTVNKLMNSGLKTENIVFFILFSLNVDYIFSSKSNIDDEKFDRGSAKFKRFNSERF